ncbi:hybrid sensor histidine kinase/response regulator [Phenylobacterium deserti]|uniref:histidine kinase n=1 Tax=Phenylobacterium deserti TaxID=1914756 RepID=A0A328AWZ1_9CAUL|nr:PAS domain-containing hybrid sensor histidine kinase/response regulator [Phenylobacterium deserti]RAK58104.1 hybrid sensor histidine kinase/response regulator [Phenylobacterium deserti]
MSLPAYDSESRFRLLIEAVSDHAIYMLDPEGRVQTWNPAAERIKGYTKSEVEGQSFERFFTPEDRAAGAPQDILRRAREHGRVESEGWRMRRDGSRFWALATVHAMRSEAGELIGFAKITRDMSERRAAEQALLESERRFRHLVAGVVDYAIYMLDVDGTISNWNRGAERIKGYTSDEVVGRHFSLFYSPEDRRRGAPAAALERARAEGRFEAEGWRVRKDGQHFWASVVIDAIHDDEGRLIGFAKITRDATERRNAQLELQKANERLAQAQKMEAIGQLTGGVAHDFNNLLMVVSGQAELLRRRLADDPRAAKALDAIDMASRRGQDLTRHLLAFARRQRLRPMAVALSDRAAALQEVLDTSLGRSIHVTVDLPEALWPVEVDPGELELALLNMAVNARDAMPGGGAISIRGENRTLKAGEVEDLAGDHVALTIQDTGQGIPPDILARVFEPFFTTKEVNRGTGLGLSQVYGFVQQSGGRVTVDSHLGRGTTFTIYLPRTNADPKAPAATLQVGAPRGVSVLVVEDNPEVAEVAAGLIEQLGNQVRVVGSAEAALRALEEGPQPDLVFSDIVMAGEMDGLALARRLREERPGLPVLLATGYSRAANQMTDEFPILAKPYQLSDLSRALAKVLASGAPQSEAV